MEIVLKGFSETDDENHILPCQIDGYVFKDYEYRIRENNILIRVSEAIKEKHPYLDWFLLEKDRKSDREIIERLKHLYDTEHDFIAEPMKIIKKGTEFSLVKAIPKYSKEELFKNEQYGIF